MEEQFEIATEIQQVPGSFDPGLVRSRPGPGGGYELCRATNQISILDVVKTVAPIERIHSCPLGLKSHLTLCPLHAELDKAYAATEKAFANVTIKDLVESASSIKPLCEVLSRKPLAFSAPKSSS